MKLNKTKLTLDLGATYKLKVTGASKSITWASSDKKVAAVSSDGLVTALLHGTTTVTASISGNKLTCKITVTDDLSDDWKDFAMIINGKLYKLPFDFKQLQDAGWECNFADYGLDKYSVEPGLIIGTVFNPKHSEYDSDLYVGFKNTGKKKTGLKNCKVDSICINNKFAKKPVQFILPKGIKPGSTALDILEAYDDPSYSEKIDYGYWDYQYKIGDSEAISMELLIDDDIGLYEVTFKAY